MPRDSGRITGEKSVKIGALAEIFDGENRVAMTPDSAVQLQKLDLSIRLTNNEVLQKKIKQ